MLADFFNIVILEDRLGDLKRGKKRETERKKLTLSALVASKRKIGERILL